MFYAQSFQMNDIKHTNTSIKHFVREHLGCACPDEVFDNIRVVDRCRIFDLSNTVYEIGGRLLVAVITPSDWHEVENNLAQLIDAGKQFRDQHGYNRFRLVIATGDTDAIASLQAAFRSQPNVDEKTHLHVIRPEAIPSNVSAEST